MFTSLLRHEFRTMACVDLSVIMMLVMVHLVATFIGWLQVPVLSSLMSLVAVIATVGLGIAVAARIAVAYWQNMYGARGYFTMTLPATGAQLFWAKAIYACVMILFVSGLIAAAWLTTVPLVLGLENAQVFDQVRAVIEVVGTGRMLGLSMVAAVLVCCRVVSAASAMTLSSSGRFHHLGHAAPIIALAMLYMLYQLLSFVGVMLVPPSLDLTSLSVVARIPVSPMIEAMRNDAEPTLLGLGWIPLSVIEAGALAWLAVRHIDRHTSLR